MGEKLTTHTPTPWGLDPDDRPGMEWNIHIVEERDHNQRVAFMTSGPEAEPNASFLVHAANHHDELVAALRASIGRMLNVKIDLDVGATKAKASASLASAIKTAEDVLANVGADHVR